MNALKTRLSTLLCCLLLATLCLGTGSAIAQTVTGSITGEVTDATGAVIPKATVIVLDTDTGVTTSTPTNSAGVYAVRFLPIGHYTVTVSAPGFGPKSVPVFTLEINQTVKLNTQLVAGNQTEVDVDSTSSTILNTTDGTLGITLSANEIANIPLEGRNFSSVTMFQPGAVNTDPTGLTGQNAIERNQYSNGVASINGNRAQANNYLLDGIDLNEVQNNLIGYNPAPDAIGEIKVISANAPATYGNVNGGSVISVLKSGTNKFHGSAYGYLQNDKLDANSWTNKHHPAGSTSARNPFTQTIFGGTIGGPVRIPHLFDGRDKLFFFGDYEGTREHNSGTGYASLLTPAMLKGDFSAYSQQLYNTQAYNPVTGITPAYAGNQVPVVNPVAKFLASHPEFYPAPNVKPTAGTLTGSNYLAPNRAYVKNNQFDIKIEYDPKNNDKITGFYSQSRARDGNVVVLPISFPSNNIFPSTLGGGTWVHTFSPSIVNEFRVGFTRVNWGQGVPTDPTGFFGFNGDSKVGIPSGPQKYVGFAGNRISNNVSTVGNQAAPQVFIDNNFTYGDNITIQRGKHLISAGLTAIRYQEQYTQNQNAGSLGFFQYTGIFTSNQTLPNAPGYGPADFILDNVYDAQIQNGAEFGNRQWRVAGFFQDDWKATPKLTFNLGIRYEYDQPLSEVHNRNANVLPGGIVEYAGSVPVGAPAGSTVCKNGGCYNANYKQIMPRFGFAYQANQRFVVRGGYGATSFFEGNAANQRLTNNNPFVSYYNKQALAPSATNGSQAYTVEDGFTTNISNLNNSGAGYGQWPQNIQPAYIQEFNLTTEYQVNTRTSLTVGYVGETGQHIEDYGNANQLTAAQAAIIGGLASGAPIPASAVSPYANLVGQGGSLLITESRAMMNYNALQATLRQRESHGLEYTLNYTYARAMTNSSGNYGTPNVTGSSGAFQDYYNSHADYGPSGQDVRNNLSAVVVYALPVGRGKQYGTHINRLLDEAVGGWSLSSSMIAFTGVPVTMGGNGSSNTGSYGGSRPNQYRHIKIVNRSINNWFGTDASAVPCTTVTAQNVALDNGTCAYGQPATYTFGSAAIGTERAPGYYQMDSSLFKDFHITEGQKVGFRLDAFNILNVADYGNPDSNLGDYNPDPTQNGYGIISSVRNQERRLQLALNYSF